MCQRLRALRALLRAQPLSRGSGWRQRGGVILVIAAARFPHSVTLLTPLVECRALRDGPRGWLRPSVVVEGRGKRRAAPERARARVPVSRVGISSTPWHREIKIHSRLLFAHWRMCVKGSRKNNQWRRHQAKHSRLFSKVSFHAVGENYCTFWSRGFLK